MIIQYELVNDEKNQVTAENTQRELEWVSEWVREEMLAKTI